MSNEINDVLLAGYARQSADKDEVIQAQSERIKALEFEIENLRQFVYAFAKNSDNSFGASLKVMAQSMIEQWDAEGKQAPESTEAAPKFRVGDKVRVKASDSYNEKSPFDTIAVVLIGCYRLNYLDAKSVSEFTYEDWELEAYTEESASE